MDGVSVTEAPAVQTTLDSGNMQQSGTETNSSETIQPRYPDGTTFADILTGSAVPHNNNLDSSDQSHQNTDPSHQENQSLAQQLFSQAVPHAEFTDTTTESPLTHINYPDGLEVSSRNVGSEKLHTQETSIAASDTTDVAISEIDTTSFDPGTSTYGEFEKASFLHLESPTPQQSEAVQNTKQQTHAPNQEVLHNQPAHTKQRIFEPQADDVPSPSTDNTQVTETQPSQKIASEGRDPQSSKLKTDKQKEESSYSKTFAKQPSTAQILEQDLSQEIASNIPLGKAIPEQVTLIIQAIAQRKKQSQKGPEHHQDVYQNSPVQRLETKKLPTKKKPEEEKEKPVTKVLEELLIEFGAMSGALAFIDLNMISGEVNQEAILHFAQFLNQTNEYLFKKIKEGIPPEIAIINAYEELVELCEEHAHVLPENMGFAWNSNGRILPMLRGNSTILYYDQGDTMQALTARNGIMTSAKDFIEIPPARPQSAVVILDGTLPIPLTYRPHIEEYVLRLAQSGEIPLGETVYIDYTIPASNDEPESIITVPICVIEAPEGNRITTYNPTELQEG